MKCEGELFLCGGTEEYADPAWSYHVRAQCNAGRGGDCGFDIVVDEFVGLEGQHWAITSTDMATLEAQHHAHSRGHEGCDCTELCSMGPTCPGGSLAGLPGSGCWRTEEASDGR